MEGPLDIEVTSGNVNAGLLGVSSVNILCRSGNVKVQPDPSFRGFYDLKTLSGSVSAPESLKETTDTIQVETYSVISISYIETLLTNDKNEIYYTL